MSENVDLVRSVYADWERTDFSSADWADPDIEYVYRTKAEEYRQIDGERILVLARSSGRGKTSGAEITHARANLFHIRGGKVTRAVFY
jgi:ketosteroid isomerase-like protein